MIALIGPVLAVAFSGHDEWRLGLVLGLYGVIAILEGLVIGPYVLHRTTKVPGGRPSLGRSCWASSFRSGEYCLRRRCWRLSMRFEGRWRGRLGRDARSRRGCGNLITLGWSDDAATVAPGVLGLVESGVGAGEQGFYRFEGDSLGDADADRERKPFLGVGIARIACSMRSTTLCAS